MNTKSKKNSTQKLRIIAGTWRGRQLAFPAIEGLRPTGDRIRETLFNWLMYEIQGRRCLDAFAGSGALGLEALSRGAQHVTFLEKDAKAGGQLQVNLQTLQAKTSATHIQTCDTLSWLDQSTVTPFDIIFLDPPFSLDAWQTTVDTINNKQWLAPAGWIYIESAKDSHFTPPPDWRLHREKTSGNVVFRLYQNRE